jgi:predicted permease
MLQILTIVAPVFELVGVGWGLSRAGLVGAEGGRALGAATIWVAMPAMILRAFLDNGVAEMIDWRIMLGYGAPSLLLLLGGFAVYRRLGRDDARAGMAALGGAAPNSGFFGFPMVTLAFGLVTGAAVLANAMIVENIVMIPLGLALAAGLKRGGAWAALRQAFANGVLRNPLVLAVIAGAALSAAGLGLPGPVDTAVAMLASAAAPLALLVIGVTLFGLPRKAGGPDAIGAAATKLAVQPALVMAAMAVIPGVDPVRAAGMALTAAAPMITIYPLLGARFGQDRFCAAALMLAMLGAMLTLPLWLALIGPG